MVHANAVLSPEIYKIVCITNKKSVSMSAFYSQYFFLGPCFAKSALNPMGPLKCAPQSPQTKGSSLGSSMTSVGTLVIGSSLGYSVIRSFLRFSMIRSSQESSVIASFLRSSIGSAVIRSSLGFSVIASCLQSSVIRSSLGS